jgi:PTS system galactitol-specific IIA component
MAVLASVIDKFIGLDLVAGSAQEALEQISNHALAQDLVHASWREALIRREAEFATGLPTAIPVAIPHTASAHVRADGFGFFRLVNPVQFLEMGTADSQLDVLMIFPLLITNPENQIDLLQAVIAMIQDIGKLESLLTARTEAEVVKLLSS